MNWSSFIPYVLVMAGVTYLTRVLPMVLIRKKIRNRFLRSFLYYVPFAVLAAMTFPAVLDSTGNGYASLLGTVAALVLGWLRCPLLAVALAACGAAFLGLLVF